MISKAAKAWGWRAAASALFGMTACGQAAPAESTNVAAAEQPAQAEPAAASVATSDDATNFALGNVLFIMFHELGHALISEFDLPVLGREEDAVDIFASVFLAPDKDDPTADASILTDAITGWFAYAEMTALEEIEWWEVHGPDRQRAYQIACLLYGSNAGAYDELAEQIGLPQDRRDSCDEDYQSAFASWGRLLLDHIVQEGQPAGARMTVQYDDASSFEAERDILREGEVLESMATEMSSVFRLPRAITLKAAKCGEPNAYWDPEAAEITVCYELVRDYVQVHQALSQAVAQ
jgi:hypothetical protein